MAAALVTLLLMSWGGLAVVTGVGYAAAWGWAEPIRHVRLAIPAFLLGTLAHALTLFYFIGTGKAVKDAVGEAGLDGEWLRETRGFKAEVFGPALAAIGMIMVTSILGGGVDTGRLPGWLHGALGVGTLLIAAHAVVREVSCVSRNLKLLERLDAILRERQELGRTL